MVCVDKLLKGVCEMFLAGGIKNVCVAYMREGRLLMPGWSLACLLKRKKTRWAGGRCCPRTPLWDALRCEGTGPGARSGPGSRARQSRAVVSRTLLVLSCLSL